MLTYADVSIRQHTSAYVCHTNYSRRIHLLRGVRKRRGRSCTSTMQTPHVSIRQHTSAYVSRRSFCEVQVGTTCTSTMQTPLSHSVALSLSHFLYLCICMCVCVCVCVYVCVCVCVCVCVYIYIYTYIYIYMTNAPVAGHKNLENHRAVPRADTPSHCCYSFFCEAPYSAPFDLPADVSRSQHTPAYASIRQHTPACVLSVKRHTPHPSTCQHTSADVSIRQC
jgi:uncharacterized membrane protein